MLEKQVITIDILKSVKKDIAEMKEDISGIKQNTSLIPAMREDIGVMKKDISEMKSHTSIIPAMQEDTSEIKQNTKEIVDKLWEKYEEMSKEIAEMKITLSRIEAKVFG